MSSESTIPSVHFYTPAPADASPPPPPSRPTTLTPQLARLSLQRPARDLTERHKSPARRLAHGGGGRQRGRPRTDEPPVDGPASRPGARQPSPARRGGWRSLSEVRRSEVRGPTPTVCPRSGGGCGRQGCARLILVWADSTLSHCD